MTTDEIKALLEHVAGDAEAIATAIGKPEIAASIEKLKHAAEEPFVIEAVKLAINYGAEKFGKRTSEAAS